MSATKGEAASSADVIEGMREAALERAAKALYEFDFGQERTNIEFPPWEEQAAGHLQERYRRRAALAAAAFALPDPKPDNAAKALNEMGPNDYKDYFD